MLPLGRTTEGTSGDTGVVFLRILWKRVLRPRATHVRVAYARGCVLGLTHSLTHALEGLRARVSRRTGERSV